MSVSVDFSTIPEMFDRITTKYATEERPMLMHKVEKLYKGISFLQCRRRVELFALGLASLGVKKDEKVAIISENRPEWVIADMAIVALGAVDVPIYPTLTAPQIAYIPRVALPFCRVSLKAARPSKIPQNPQTWGDHIKKRRLVLGLYQVKVAEIIGVDECTVANWEKNRTNPMLWTLPKIIQFLGYDPSASKPETRGEKLLRYRKYRGMTQKELAKLIGIDPTTLSMLERNRSTCLRPVKKKLETFLRNIDF
jgi:transcriptional regulator with XRE-family HTH domain